jgi:hypothetical protein
MAEVFACTDKAHSRSNSIPGFLGREWVFKLVFKMDEDTMIMVGF